MEICEIRIKTRFPVKFEDITKFSTLITFEVLKKIKKKWITNFLLNYFRNLPIDFRKYISDSPYMMEKIAPLFQKILIIDYTINFEQLQIVAKNVSSHANYLAIFS